MPTTLKSKPPLAGPDRPSRTDNRLERGWESQLDDRHMVAVYAFSAALMVVGLLLLSA